MIKRLSVLIGQFAVATLLAQILMVSYLALTGHLDRAKTARLIAVFHGMDLPLAAPAPAAAPAEKPVSMEDIVLARAAKLQQFTQREQALDQRKSLIDAQQSRVAEQQLALDNARTAFQKQLEAWETGAQRQALENATAVIAGMKPPQAKEHLMLMLQRDEIDWVVRIFEALQPTQRAKLMAEFKTAEENEKLAEVIRRIRDAATQTAAEEAKAVLQSAANP